MRGRKVDANHRAIREALRARGWRVIDLSAAGLGLPDLFCVRPGRSLWIEVKDGSKPPSARKLTEAQAEIHAAFTQAGTPIRVVTRVEDVGEL